MSKTRSIVLAAWLCAAWTAAVCRAEAPASPTIRVGSERDFRPYSFTDADGRATGFSPDLLHAVAEAMGLRLHVTTGPWDEVWSGLLAGQFDVLPTVARTPGREPLVDLGLPHTETFDAFFRRKDQPTLPDLAAAAGMDIIVLRSDAAHHQLTERGFDGQVIPVDTIADGLRLIAAGRHDAMLCSKLIGLIEMRAHGVRGVSAGPPVPDYKRVFSFAVRKGDAELLEKLNQGLLIVRKDGAYDRIYRRWLTVEEPWHRWLPLFKWSVAGLVSLAVLAGALHYLVRLRTRQLGRARDALQGLAATLEQRVTDRTAELRDSEGKYRQLFENMTEGFALHEIVTDDAGRPVDYRYLEVNPAFERLTGLKADDLPGRRVLEVLPGTEAHWIEAFGRVALTGEPARIEDYSAELGRWYEVFAYQPAPRRFAVVFRDITMRKRAEVELRESEQRLNRAQEIANLGSWELDVVNGSLTWSDEVYRIFGLRPQEFGATFDAFLERVHPDDRAAVNAAYADSLRENRDSYEIEHRVIRMHTGEVRIVHEKCEHLRDGAGEIVRSVGMVHDITARKRAEEDLRRVNENLEQFAYVAAHDLQEPLRIMSSYSQLLAKRYRGKFDADADDFIGFIVESAARMQKLIMDLLAYSRAGRGDVALADVDCHALARKVAASLRATIEAAGASVLIDPLPVIRAHEPSLIQLFQNLIGNALKFRREDAALEVRISAVLVNGHSSLVNGQRDQGPMTNDPMTNDAAQPHVTRPPGVNVWRFAVRDNGIGIEPQYRERIFGIFQRLHARDQYEGTGIGLSICKRVVEHLGGKIWVESEPGRGSTFYFTVTSGEGSH